MPFTWDATAVEAWDEIPMHLKNTVDPMMMVTGVNSITESNAQDFYTRVHFYERLFGPFRYSFDDETNKREPVYLSTDEAKSLIGYRTNVSPETKTKFRNRMVANFEREVRF